VSRQQRLMAWYTAYMKSRIVDLEKVLEDRNNATTEFCRQRPPEVKQ
jgi:hypothetical protein